MAIRGCEGRMGPVCASVGILGGVLAEKGVGDGKALVWGIISIAITLIFGGIIGIIRRKGPESWYHWLPALTLGSFGIAITVAWILQFVKHGE